MKMGLVRITGTLTANAELRVTTHKRPRARLYVRMTTGDGIEHVAAQDYGTSYAGQQAARHKAGLLRRDTAATVTAQHLKRVRGDDSAVELFGSVDIMSHTPARNFTEPAESTP